MPVLTTYRPNGAYKLLTLLLYGSYPYLVAEGDTLHLTSIRRMARMAGTQTSRLKVWLIWLWDQGYIEDPRWAPNGRSVQFRLRRPPNVR